MARGSADAGKGKTNSAKGTPINGDEALEKEADTIGEKALKEQSEPTSPLSQSGSIASPPVQRKILLGDRLLAIDVVKMDTLRLLLVNEMSLDEVKKSITNTSYHEFLNNINALSPELKETIKKEAEKNQIDLNADFSTGNFIADEAINIILQNQLWKNLIEQANLKLNKFYEEVNIKPPSDVPVSKKEIQENVESKDDPRTNLYSSVNLGNILSEWYASQEIMSFSNNDELFAALLQHMINQANTDRINDILETNKYPTISRISWRFRIDNLKESLADELIELVESLDSAETMEELVNASFLKTGTVDTFKKLADINSKLSELKGLNYLCKAYQENEASLLEFNEICNRLMVIYLKPEEKSQKKASYNKIYNKISAVKLLEGIVNNFEIILEKMSHILGLEYGKPFKDSKEKNAAEEIAKIINTDLYKDMIVVIQSATAEEAGRDSKQEDRYPIATGTLYYAGTQPLIPLPKEVNGVLVELKVLQKLTRIFHILVKHLSGNELNNYTLSYHGQQDKRNYLYIRHGVPVDKTAIEKVYLELQLQEPSLEMTSENLKASLQTLFGETDLTNDIKRASKSAAYRVGTATTLDERYQHLKTSFPKVSPTTLQEVKFEKAAKRRDRCKGQLAAMGSCNAAGYALVLGATREKNRTPDLISGKPFLASQKLVESTGWEWLHIRSAGLGGATDPTNLVVGTHAANSHMIPFEHQIKELAALATTDQPLWVRWSATNTAPGYAQTISIQWAAPAGLHNEEKKMFLPPVTWEANMKAIFNPFNGQVFDKMQRDLDWRSALLLTDKAQQALIYLVKNKPDPDISKLELPEKQAILSVLSSALYMTKEQLQCTIQQVCGNEPNMAIESAAWLMKNTLLINQAITKNLLNKEHSLLPT